MFEKIRTVLQILRRVEIYVSANFYNAKFIPKNVELMDELFDFPLKFLEVAKYFRRTKGPISVHVV